MEFILSIGERLREERERLDLSQSQMAELAKNLGAKGATRQSQALYEKGEQSPSAAYIAAITTSGADVLYILTGQRGAPPAPVLSPRQLALLDNYDHAPEDGKKIIEGTASLAAQSAKGMKKGKAA
jgi:transcriptional regulator with XRE-family HTH domain